MNRFQLGTMLFLWCCLVRAQTPEPETLVLDVTKERARIESERQVGTSYYIQQEASCYDRFAVSDCLQEVRVRRRLMLDDLRRQTMVLNDVERRKKSLTKLDLIRRKSDQQNSN
jgi:colicin import membrane protein